MYLAMSTLYNMRIHEIEKYHYQLCRNNTNTRLENTNYVEIIQHTHTQD